MNHYPEQEITYLFPFDPKVVQIADAKLHAQWPHFCGEFLGKEVDNDWLLSNWHRIKELWEAYLVGYAAGMESMVLDR